MPRIRQLFVLAGISCVIAMVAFAVSACPYCPPTDPTFSERLAESDAACIVKFLHSENGEELSMQKTTFEVLKPIRATDTTKTGTQIEVPFGVTANTGELFLLMGQLKEGEMEWSLPTQLDELAREYDYIRKAPSLDQPPIERLAYYLKFLDHNNDRISNDAFSEFARSKFEDVEQLAPLVSREKVRSWLEDTNPQLVVRRAFYGMLLGLCGNDDDANYLRQRVMAPIDSEQNRIGIEGMMGGYLLLRGTAGLNDLVTQKLDGLSDDVSAVNSGLVDADALRKTLVFLWDYRRSQFTEEALKQAMRRFLDQPVFADIAIVDLARWKDWSVLEKLIQAYGKDPWDSRSAQEKIIAFAISCRKDVPASAQQLPPAAEKAQAFLDQLDPEIVQSVRQGMGGFAPAIKSGRSAAKSPPGE